MRLISTLASTSVPQFTSVLTNAGTWFLDSGIQEPNGGVARYHLVTEGRNLPISTEITGYMCSALIYLHKRTGDAKYLQAAVRAARFLTRTAWLRKLRAMPFEVGTPLSPAYMFDCGMIVRGLLLVYRHTNQEEYLQIAREVGLFMGRAFRHGGGLHPIVRLPSLTPEAYERRWSREPGCFLLKAAMAWDDLAPFFPLEPFVDWYEQALAESLESWGDFLPGTSDPYEVMNRLHAHCYFLEGMLARAGRPEIRATLSEAIDRTAEYFYQISPRFERSDVGAQLLRARLYAARMGAVPLNEAAASAKAERLMKHQEADGSFRFGVRDGQPAPVRNPVSTAFSMQAIDQWFLYQSQAFCADLAELV